MSTLNIVREVPFKNWTSTDFTYKYAGEEYTFATGGTYSIPSDIALHFAKHLAIRELHSQADTARKEAKADKRSSDEIVQAAAVFEALPENLIKEYQERCFPKKNRQPSATNSFERIDVSDEPSKDAVPMTENKTDTTSQSEISDDDDADTSDDKNNAGTPIIKGMSKRGKTKDSEYSR